MTVTAARLGSAPITVDWSNLIRVPVRKGPSYEIRPYTETWETLKARFTSGEVGFFDCPVDHSLSQAKESEALATGILKPNLFTDCLFLGIGGSALGPSSLLASLQDRVQSRIKFHFVENPDPLDWKRTINHLDPATTLVCVVTKSGTTFETIAQFLLAMDWIGRNRLKTHVVAITDPTKGDLKAFAMKEHIPTLHIAPSIGGRFSVFSPVGLFAAALSGLSVSDFLHGAKLVRDYVEKTPLERNPLFVVGHELIRHSHQRPIHVCMPYSTRLRSIGDWFVQLWGESLGKDGKGFTPLAAVGATDQHSILQLLRDGPDDKVTLFLSIDQVEDPIKIPRKLHDQASFKMLEGHSLQELLHVEHQATSLVLTKQGRPNLNIQLDRLDERALGALYFAFATMTAFTGTMMGVNPFDQPGVEEGKVYIREALAKGSFSESKPDEDENSPVGRLRRNSST